MPERPTRWESPEDYAAAVQERLRAPRRIEFDRRPEVMDGDVNLTHLRHWQTPDPRCFDCAFPFRLRVGDAVVEGTVPRRLGALWLINMKARGIAAEWEWTDVA